MHEAAGKPPKTHEMPAAVNQTASAEHVRVWHTYAKEGMSVPFLQTADNAAGT